MKKARLGVNVDHVATLRQARGEEYPSPVIAAELLLKNEVEQITAHLREDRRHIQDQDVPALFHLCQDYHRLFNLEIGTNASMLKWVLKNPYYHWLCLVPEHRQEKTTEGGLNLKSPTVYEQVKIFCSEVKSHKPQTRISLFLESVPDVLEKVVDLPVDAVEIHTGEYAHTFLQSHLKKKSRDDYLQDFAMAKEQLERYGVAVHAGHGLTEESLGPLVQKHYFEEYNIGHWIVAQGIFEGLIPVVKRLQRILTCVS
jgi:pyridoxine 5-phosphate synthase